ncbi:hypothetical protein OU994_25200 [Pseudoduganella sp. SL102]|uniref:hypothetical protein n=1 Tax=Pseudoduganella sp. SL102 TaxID=2995154 RepID=UPI00248D1EEC|nr:hypothetical protein [Pseudoduganella sp. SL102]WBS01540.1 hypothetical protein OU994_25200 [Pseudoduganella sp. SL102]
MSKYKLLDGLMGSVYKADLGLTEDEGRDLYVRMLGDADWHTRIAKEVSLASSDAKFSWIDFFDKHDLYAADSEREARRYAEKIIVEPLRLKGQLAGCRRFK